MITLLAPADHDRWAELWRAYLAFYDTELPPATYAHTWSRIMAGEGIHGRAARTQAGLVGITHFLYHPHGWSTSPACYLQDLYVDAAARNTGAGRALIEAVANDARKQGATRLYWTTQPTNATAMTLYDRLARNTGFIKYDYPL